MCLSDIVSVLFSGEFVVVNKHLLHDLTEMGLWSPVVKNKIIYDDGSVQKIPEIPEELKMIYKYELSYLCLPMLIFSALLVQTNMHSFLFISASFRTVWEIKQKTLVDMAVDRGCYIDQSQSLNIHMDQPNFGKLTSLHFHAWSRVLTVTISYAIILS